MDLQGLDVSEIIVEAEKNGMSFDKLLTIPEQDDWLYTDWKSTSCVAFILELIKQQVCLVQSPTLYKLLSLQ